MTETDNEQDATVDPHEGLRILESAKPGVCKTFEGQGDSPASAVESAIIGYQNAVTEMDHLRTRITELEAERDRLRENLDHHTRKAHRRDAQHWCQYRIGLEACRDSVEALARSTDTDCCNQPDQCWEPCGDLGKSEAHAKPADTEDE